MNAFEAEDKDDEIVKYKLTSVETLVAMCENKDNYIDFFNEIESKQLLAKNALWIKEVEDLKKNLHSYFEAGAMPNKEKFIMDKKFANLTRRYVNLTVSVEEKEAFDTLYSKFKALPSGKHAIENKTKRKEDIAVPSASASEELYVEMNNILKNKKRGRLIKVEDVILAKKLSGPQNRLDSEKDLLNLLVALNLLCTAVRTKVEKKMQISDVYNSLKRIIKRGNDFPELSIFTTEYNGKNFLIFDIHRIQFRFEGVSLSLDQLSYIKDRNNNVTKWDGTLSYLHTCELLEVLNNK